MMERISGTTSLMGVLGARTAYSLSPAMHNAMLAQAGVDAVYLGLPFESESDLAGFLNLARRTNCLGFNVTVPWKEAAGRLVDEVDRSAAICGAINTIQVRQGRLLGFNTDGRGLVRSLEEEMGVGLAGADLMVLGAGGAARGIVPALLGANVASVLIWNRSSERATELVSLLGDRRLRAVDAPEFRDRVLINASSAGMQDDCTALFGRDELCRARFFYDIVYSPEQTVNMHVARSAGVPTSNGLGMLLWQAVEAFELMTGSRGDAQAARRAMQAARNHSQ